MHPCLQIFALVCAITRGTCHATDRSEGSTIIFLPLRRIERTFASFDPTNLQRQKCLDRHTQRQTSVAQLFSSDPQKEIFEHKGSNANPSDSLYSAGLKERPASSIALCQNRGFFIFPALSGFKPTTLLQMTGEPCHGLPMVCPSRMVSFQAQSDQQFGCKMQKAEITCHVQQSRVIWHERAATDLAFFLTLSCVK